MTLSTSTLHHYDQSLGGVSGTIRCYAECRYSECRYIEYRGAAGRITLFVI